MSHTQLIDIFREPRRLDDLGPRLIGGGVILTVLLLLGSYLVAANVPGIGMQGFWYAYLVGVANILAIALGALFFTILQHATGAGWSVVVRRLAEGIAMTIPFIGLLLLPILFDPAFSTIYGAWQAKAHSPLVMSKSSYLTPTVFRGQIIGFFVLWSAMAWYFHSRSVLQDRTGDPQISRRMRTVSYPCIILFALSVSLAAFNLLMSINPEWFSTIFGVYFFAGCAMSFFAFLGIVMYFLRRRERLHNAISVEHFHDVGKFCFAFIVFWAYIAVSQYLLIWYANLPEETIWFRPHHRDATWGKVSSLLILGHFFLPFLLILSRHVKRRPGAFAAAGVWILLMHWLDHFWIVMPRIEWAGPSTPPLENVMLMSLLCSAGFFSLLVVAVAWVLGRESLVPERDPRLHESLAFENF